MTTELGPAARALLDAARRGMSPDGAATRRVRAKIAAAVGRDAVAATSVKLAAGGKIALVSVVAAALTGAYLYLRGGEQPVATIPHVTVVESRPVPPQTRHLEAPSVDIDAIELDPPPPAPPRPAPHVARPVPARVAPSSAPPAAATRPEVHGDLSREVELVDQAMAGLRRGDTAAALDAIRRYDVETAGRGQLAEDAAAIAVEALCQRGDPTSGAMLEAFEHRWPHSAQRARLLGACHR
jgi:hypothetical protein